MARKLLVMAALICLVFIQAPPGFADTYALYGGENSPTNVVYAWTEIHGENQNSYPGDVNGQFTGFGHPYDSFANNYQNWNIPLISNAAQGTVVAMDDYTITIKIVYSTPVSVGDPTFTVVGSTLTGIDLPTITSYDTVVTTIATYTKDPAAPRPNLTNGFTLIGTESMTAFGHDQDTGQYFTLSGDMYELYGDHSHYGYFTSLTLTFPAAEPSAVPIPGALWLLGSGLFGLACLRPRRRS